MVSQLVKIVNPTGLHLRPAGNLCREAAKFKSRITYEHNGYIANVKSVLNVLGSCVRQGDEVMLICEGEDEQEALRHLTAYIAGGLEN